jgi:hypothetical protein
MKTLKYALFLLSIGLFSSFMAILVYFLRLLGVR